MKDINGPIYVDYGPQCLRIVREEVKQARRLKKKAESAKGKRKKVCGKCSRSWEGQTANKKFKLHFLRGECQL